MGERATGESLPVPLRHDGRRSVRQDIGPPLADRGPHGPRLRVVGRPLPQARPGEVRAGGRGHPQRVPATVRRPLFAPARRVFVRGGVGVCGVWVCGGMGVWDGGGVGWGSVEGVVYGSMGVWSGSVGVWSGSVGPYHGDEGARRTGIVGVSVLPLDGEQTDQETETRSRLNGVEH